MSKHIRKWLPALVLGLMVVAGVAYAVAPEKIAPDRVAVLYTRGMTCGSCAGKIEKALAKEKGVASVEVDVEGGRVFASFDCTKTHAENLRDKVSGVGYPTNVAAVLTTEQFRALAGRDLGAPQPAAKGGGSGCGGGCCSKKQ